MMETKTGYTYHLKIVAIKTTIITTAVVVGMLLAAMLLNLFMMGSV